MYLSYVSFICPTICCSNLFMQMCTLFSSPSANVRLLYTFRAVILKQLSSILPAGSVLPSDPNVTVVNNVSTVASKVSNSPLYFHSLLKAVEGLHPPSGGERHMGFISLAIASLVFARVGSVLSLSVKFAMHVIAFFRANAHRQRRGAEFSVSIQIYESI